ncbi:putative 2,5-dichloro-2,5-cyclohexadiene-1,4-diol dehydrogenase [Acephala macrosclerotiorum]|nr:putative 2,5-dichloro-2,5-cyclohexadiene-1,4-diol dehydrogenase [Acephala macrosclerotiorum]
MRILESHSPVSGRLAGQVALITGGAGSIGLATAHRFLHEGAKVVLIDINSRALQDAKTDLEAKLPAGIVGSESIYYITADITSEPAVEAFVAETIKVFGRLDSVFLCAGLSYPSASVLETSVDLYDRVMSIDCRSAFLGIKHAGTAMRDLKNGGSIILASSIAGLRATPGLIAYSAAKYALRGMCVTAAAELGPYGIRVNTVHPCGVNTPMFLAAWQPEKIATMLGNVPLGRWAEVEDVAAVVSFLASKDSQFMTGGRLKIGGGAVSS